MDKGRVEDYKTYKGYIIAPGIRMPRYDIYEYEIFETREQYEGGNPVHTSESETEAEQWVDRQIELSSGKGVSMTAREHVSDQDIDEFLRELEELYRRHGLSLAHEDTHGAFLIEKLSEDNVRWVKDARREAKYQ